jgi:hypothetical protein
MAFPPEWEYRSLRHVKIFKLKDMRHAFRPVDRKKHGAGDLEMDSQNRKPWEK